MRNTLIAAVLALVLALAGSLLGAQDYVALQRRADSLHARATAATNRLRAYDDSVHKLDRSLDSIRVGPLRIVAEPAVAALADSAARMAIDSLSGPLGSTLARLEPYTIVFRSERYGTGTPRRDSAVVIEVQERVSGPPILNIRQKFDARLVAASLRVHAPGLVFRAAAPEFLAWLGGGASVAPLSVEDWRSMRLALVASPAVVGRRCYGGDLPSCSLALQLTTPADPVTQLYDAADRRHIVERNDDVAIRVDALAARQCKDGSDYSCVSLLRRFPPASLPAPMVVASRATLSRLALELGGNGAVERLLDAPAEPMQRLAAAARLDEDSIIARWQQKARETRAPSRDLSPEVALVTVMWALGLGALSLRSSRWR